MDYLALLLMIAAIVVFVVRKGFLGSVGNAELGLALLAGALICQFTTITDHFLNL